MKSSVAEFSRAELKIKISTTTVTRLPILYSLITVEYGILTIKKTVKTLQVGLYSFILNVSIKKKYNKKKKFLEVTCILVDAKYF